MTDTTTLAPVARTSAEIEAELATIVDPIDLPEPSSDDEAALAAAADLASAESDASRKGWVPRDQYKGDASKWVDAKTFNARGERFTVNLQREVQALKDRINAFEGTKAAFVKFQEETVARKDAELKDAIAALRVQRSQATREGEDELAVQLEDRIELLRDQQKEVKAIPAAPPPPQQADPVLTEWVEDGNEWFKDDAKLREYAIALGEEIVQSRKADGEPPLRGRKFLDKVRERMAEEFPRRFKPKDAAPVRQNAVSGGAGGAGPRAAGHSEADLPQVDRDLMRQFIKEGLTTKEKFLNSYFSS